MSTIVCLGAIDHLARGHSNDRVTLATKFGFDTGVSANARREAAGRMINGRAEYVRQPCNASLERLGVDHIDLYYLHRVDSQTPIEETEGAMAELVKQGKVRGISTGEFSSKGCKRASPASGPRRW